MTRVVLQVSPTFSSDDARREVGRDPVPRPLRYPHHTVSLAGAMGELALAAGGTLVIGDATEWSRSVLVHVISIWRRMDDSARPALVIHICNTGDQWHALTRIADLLPPITEHLAREWKS